MSSLLDIQTVLEQKMSNLICLNFEKHQFEILKAKSNFIYELCKKSQWSSMMYQWINWWLLIKFYSAKRSMKAFCKVIITPSRKQQHQNNNKSSFYSFCIWFCCTSQNMHCKKYIGGWMLYNFTGNSCRNTK